MPCQNKRRGSYLANFGPTFILAGGGEALILQLLSLTIIAAWYWRFKDAPCDRDYTPYSYPAYFKSPWLRGGHVDIKSPLLHWSYKCWYGMLRLFGIELNPRSLNAFGMACAVMFVGSVNPMHGLVLALLLTAPTLWGHMANTEWLTVLLLSAVTYFSSARIEWAPWILIGLLPWANQKNLLLVPLVAWWIVKSYGADIMQSWLVLVPSLVIVTYLWRTKRLSDAWLWCMVVPASFGENRTFKRNTLSATKLLLPCLYLLAPLVAVCEPVWALCFVGLVALALLSKQVVPHHFLLIAWPLAMGYDDFNAGWMGLVGFAMVYAFRDGLCWYKPALLYKVTFPGYDEMMADARKIEAWIRENTPRETVIWVNGMENQIYLNAQRRAWRIEIPELEGTPMGPLPEYVVHCQQSAKKFDYSKYEPVEYAPNTIVSTSGLFSLLRLK